MIKTFSSLFKQDKEKFVVPKGVQDCISIYAMNDGSMFSALTKCKSKEFWKSHKYITLYDTGLNAEYGNKLITLSTCECSRTNGRFVVVAKKISE